jgi:hypothetical protein
MIGKHEVVVVVVAVLDVDVEVVVLELLVVVVVLELIVEVVEVVEIEVDVVEVEWELDVVDWVDELEVEVEVVWDELVELLDCVVLDDPEVLDELDEDVLPEEVLLDVEVPSPGVEVPAGGGWEKLYVTAPARTSTMMTGTAPSASGRTLSGFALKVRQPSRRMV